MGALSAVRLLVWKDLLLELRTKEILTAMAVFALLAAVVFNFAFSPSPAQAAALLPGMLWVTLAFAATLGLSRSFVLEREQQCLEALRLFDVYVTGNPESWFVFNWALVAYAFVAAGLLNAMIFFSLSRPEMAVRSIALGLMLDFGVGFVSSRLLGYQWAVAGLVAGSVVFAVTGSIQMFQVMRRLDYYYYASV
ncbi:MAG: heme exporter protein CcmB [Chloroflexi bacterium]|nr:heme exporter protein CcmB [Chloroflexota bacterium]